jgi:hypothetical protein
MVEGSRSGKDAVGNRDSVEMEANRAHRARETVFETCRFVLEELQTEAHTETYRKLIATDRYRDLMGQHHLQP